MIENARLLIVISCLCCLSCGEPALHKTVLEGYEGGKLRMKLSEVLQESLLDDGSKGYLLTIETKYSEGSRKRRFSTKRVWMKQDFTFIRSEKELISGDNVSKLNIGNNGKQMVIEREMNGKKTQDFAKIPAKHILGEIHPLLLAKDLTEPGQKKVYWIFHEELLQGVALRVKCKEKTMVNLGGKRYECMNYGIQNLAKPGHFNEYFVSLADKSLVKIVAGQLEFVPPSSRR